MLAEPMKRWDLEDMLPTTELLVSELVTNAVGWSPPALAWFEPVDLPQQPRADPSGDPLLAAVLAAGAGRQVQRPRILGHDREAGDHLART